MRWVRTSLRFQLDTLGARPVDVSDPPGRLDWTWREYDDPYVPWITRDPDMNLAYISLFQRHGKLDLGHCTVICRLPDLRSFDALETLESSLFEARVYGRRLHKVSLPGDSVMHG